MLSWSDRLGSDEQHEIKEVVKVLRSVFKELKQSSAMICPECQEVSCDDDCSNPRSIVLATVDVGVSFITFWDMYDKKVGKPKCEKKWDKLPVKERKAILDYLPLYKQSQPDKRYRKNPETFLNNRSWEDELIIAPAEPNTLDKLTSLF